MREETGEFINTHTCQHLHASAYREETVGRGAWESDFRITLKLGQVQMLIKTLTFSVTFFYQSEIIPLYSTKITCSFFPSYKFTRNFSIWALIDSKLSVRQTAFPGEPSTTGRGRCPDWCLCLWSKFQTTSTSSGSLCSRETEVEVNRQLKYRLTSAAAGVSPQGRH